MAKKYLNSLNLHAPVEGNERRLEMISDILKNGTFLPKTVEYKNIDETFMEWIKSLTIISDEGKEFPTMALFSNQRFSEYSQSWQYVDDNKNLILNFKTVTRENNPRFGNIQGGNWNIPGDRFYTMKKVKALDDNGTESYLTLKMKQPVAIDLVFKVSIFTTKYSSINEFNTIINKAFAAHQCYIAPNNHYMPMTLENISDESKYNIDDRQFYSQTYQIKVLGYIITENDYKVEETPLKYGGNLGFPVTRKKANVELEELLCEPTPESPYYYRPITVTVKFPCCNEKAKFSLDIDFTITKMEYDEYIKKIIIKRNGDIVSSSITEDTPLVLKKGDDIQIEISKNFYEKDEYLMIFKGFNPMIVYSSDLDDMESELDEHQTAEEYEFEVNNKE